MLDSLLDLLQQIDTSMLGDLSELDWTNIATYSALTLAFAGAVWTSSKNLLKFLWQKTEGIIGFSTSTLVVIALWYTLLRVHVSISFNLDKEVFDNLIWLSAILFTPYYLLHYKLLKGFLLTIARSLELTLDLLIFSWFPEKAEQNREKWKTRITTVYTTGKDAVDDFFKKAASAAQSTQMPFGLNVSTDSETISSELLEEKATPEATNDDQQDFA